MIEVKEILRLWLEGHSLRKVTTLSGVDRKTVRRYVAAGVAAGLSQDGGAGQLDDELLGQVITAVRPERPRGMGMAREALEPHRDQITKWLDQDLTLVKVHVLLGRRGGGGAVSDPASLRGRRAGVRPASADRPGGGRGAGSGGAGRFRPAGPDPRPRSGCASGGARVDLYRGLFAAHVRLPDPPPDPGGGDRRVRGGVGLFRRGVQGRHPGQSQAGDRSGRSHRAEVQRRVPGVRPSARFRH